MTRYYYEDPYCRSLEVTVERIEGNRVFLDRTICYPECGGQPGDRGTLKDSRILDTQNAGDEIAHIVDRVSFSEGEKLTLNLDWEHRYFYMQQHAAQHMVSGILYSCFDVATVSVHQGEQVLTVEIAEGVFSPEKCCRLEDLVRKAICENRTISYRECSHKEAEAMGLRRSIKVEGPVRLVVIDGVDTIACGGLHVARTGEISQFQYVGQEKIRGHVRLIFRVASSADGEIRENRRVVDALSTLFSAPVENLESEAQRVVAERDELKGELKRVREQYAAALLGSLGSGVITADLSDRLCELKDIALALDDRDRALLAVQRRGEKLLWLMAFTGKYREFDFNAHRKTLLAPVGAKGGGKAPCYQGMATGDAELFFSLFLEIFQ